MTIRQAINKISNPDSTQEEAGQSLAAIFLAMANALNINLDSQVELPKKKEKNDYHP